MDTRTTVATTVNQAQLIAQFYEHAMYLAIAQGLPQEFAASRNKEGSLFGGADFPAAKLTVLGKGLHSAGMQRQQTRFAKLGLPNCQRACRQINIFVQQSQRLGHPQAGCRN